MNVPETTCLRVPLWTLSKRGHPNPAFKVPVVSYFKQPGWAPFSVLSLSQWLSEEVPKEIKL
jgi:hypothetical protein